MYVSQNGIYSYLYMLASTISINIYHPSKVSGKYYHKEYSKKFAEISEQAILDYIIAS